MTEENHLLSFIKIQSDTIVALNDLLRMLTMPKITKESRWKEWRGLTDEEVQQLHTKWTIDGGFNKLCDDIEVILKEKNT